MVRKTAADSRSGEIDLLSLLLSAITAIHQNIWLILTFFVVGTGLGVAYFMSAKKQYENKMIVSSNILTVSYAKVLFENATVHLRQGNYAVLSSDFHIDESQAKQIASLQIENLIKADTQSKESERFLITVHVYDQAVLPKLQQGILDYLENNEFVRVRIDQHRAFLREMIQTVENELKDLQQFKIDLYSGKFFTSTNSTMMFDPTAINSKILDLTQKKIEYQNNLQLINSVQLIEGFTPLKRHNSPTLALSLAAGGSTGLFCVFMLLLLKSVRRLLAMAKSSSTQHAA